MNLINKWCYNFSASSAQLSPAITNTLTKPTPPPGSIASVHTSLHSATTTHSSFPPPLFATPLPPVSSSAPVTTSAPHPFSAESLFQSSKGKFQTQWHCSLILLFSFFSMLLYIWRSKTLNWFSILCDNQFRCVSTLKSINVCVCICKISVCTIQKNSNQSNSWSSWPSSSWIR